MPALYVDLLGEFLNMNPDELLGKLTSGLAKEGFDTTTLTTFSWQREIVELHAAFRRLVDLLPQARSWSILFEYILPIVGQRVDCVILAGDLICVIEYKGGSSASARAALQQAQEYALNLIDFHEESRGRTAIPIAVGAFKTSIALDITSEHQGAAVSATEFPDTVIRVHGLWGRESRPIDATEWNNSRYFPVPTIVQRLLPFIVTTM